MGGGGEWLHASAACRRSGACPARYSLSLSCSPAARSPGSRRAQPSTARSSGRAPSCSSLTADIQSAIGDRLLAYEALLRAGVGVLDAFWPVRATTGSGSRRRCGSRRSIQVCRDRVRRTRRATSEPVHEQDRIPGAARRQQPPGARLRHDERAAPSRGDGARAGFGRCRRCRPRSSSSRTCGAGCARPGSCCSCRFIRRRRCPRPSPSGARRCAGSSTARSGPRISSARRSPAPPATRSSKCSTAMRRAPTPCFIEPAAACRRTP